MSKHDKKNKNADTHNHSHENGHAVPAPENGHASEPSLTKAGVPRKVRTGPVMTKDGLLLRALQAPSVTDFAQAIAKYTPSRRLLKEAAKEAIAQNMDAPILTEYLNSLGVNSAVRGRAAPRPGEQRAYSVQVLTDKTSLRDGSPFVRVPLDTLGVKKQDKVAILFKADKIIIKVRGAAVADANVPVEVIGSDADGAQPAAFEASAA